MRLDELFSRALREQRCADPNDEDSEDLSYLVELHNRTTRETYDRAVAMVGSAAPDERVLGLRVLRELGPWGHRTFRADAVPLLRGVIAGHGDEPETLYSALDALAWQGDESVLPDILRFTDADDTSVRSAAIHNLTNFIDRHEPDDNLLAALLAATRDSEPGNRYSAVYDLVHWVDCARDDVRNALAARLDDDDEMVREHAIAGLARSEAGWAIVGARKPLPEVRIGSGQGEWLAFRCIAAHDRYVSVAVVVRGGYAAWSGLADVAPAQWPRWRRAAGRYADEHTPFNMMADGDLDARIRLRWHSDGVPEVTCRVGTRGKHWHERLSFCWQLQPDDVDRMCQGLADVCEWLHVSNASASPGGERVVITPMADRTPPDAHVP